MVLQREDYLTTHYVWPIQSDGDWQRRCARPMEYGLFRRVTAPYIKGVEKANGDRTTDIEWAYILLRLWTSLGNSATRCLNDPGPLKACYHKLLLSRQPERRQKGCLFALYGEAYTCKPVDDSNDGARYSPADIEYMHRAYHAGAGLVEIATKLRRTGFGAAMKMRELGLLYRVNDDFICAKDTPAPVPDSTVIDPCGETATNTIMKEKSMNTIATNPTTAIEIKTIVFGRDIATMSDDDLIEAIKRVEADIAKLGVVKTSSKKIAANIKALEKDLAAIVEVLDAR